MLPTAHPASSRDCRWRVSWSSYYMRLGRRHESMCVDVVFPKDDLAMFAYPGLHGRKGHANQADAWFVPPDSKPRHHYNHPTDSAPLDVCVANPSGCSTADLHLSSRKRRHRCTSGSCHHLIRPVRRILRCNGRSCLNFRPLGLDLFVGPNLQSSQAIAGGLVARKVDLFVLDEAERNGRQLLHVIRRSGATDDQSGRVILASGIVINSELGRVPVSVVQTKWAPRIQVQVQD